MIEIKHKEMCCGCGVCAAVCPTQCIEMEGDEEGFLYPKVNVKECIQCNRCIESCPCKISDQNSYISRCERKNTFPVVYGGWHKDDAILTKSSSGGAFTLFAEKIIENGGIVYGCILDKKADVFHQAAHSKEELELLRKSKYVQSKLGNVFKEIEDNLKKGNIILFVGTPCECEAIYSYLRKPYDNLILCDFICHGVPSPKVFKDWIYYLERKYHDKFQNISFRIKEAGWHSSGLQLGTRIVFSKKTKTNIPAFFDNYMNGFLENIYLRPACYKCNFKGKRIHTDITIGDFWGIKKLDKAMNNRNGTSIIIINSENGRLLFDTCKELFCYRQYDQDEALQRNGSYFKSAVKHPYREHFFNDYFSKGLNFAMKKYAQPWHWFLYRLFCR